MDALHVSLWTLVCTLDLAVGALGHVVPALVNASLEWAGAPLAAAAVHGTEWCAFLLHHAAAVQATLQQAAPVLPAADPAIGAHAPPPPIDTHGWEKYLAYGPWAVLILFVLSGVGLHLSEDLILIPAGILIARGDSLPFWETIIAAYVGLIVGDFLWIFMCRKFGTRMVQTRWFKRIVHPRRLLEAKHQVEARGIIVVALARFIPGTRTPVITMAGILQMSWWKLLPVEMTTCAITVPLQLGIGYLIGKGVGDAGSTGELLLKLLAACAALIAVGFGVHWWLQARRRKGRAPRSKASWLRKFGRRRRSDNAALPHQA
jgi:membrane protein DedA with SNARE-associated domain